MKHRLLALVPFLFIGWSLNADAILLSDVLPGEDPIPDDGSELFEISDQDGVFDDVNTLLFRRNAGNNASLWIYDPTNNARRLPVFGPAAPQGSSTTLSFDINTGIWSNDLGDAPVEFFSQGVGFEGALFGLLMILNGNEIFSQSALNGGMDLFATFDTDGANNLPGVFDYVAAAFDQTGACGGFIGFSINPNPNRTACLVVGMTDVIVPQRVTSPATLALVGLGLLVLGFCGVPRRRQP